jgi:hypothetical protein
MTGVGALAIETMTRDRQGTVKVVELAAIEAERLLAAPAEPVCPRRMPEQDALHARLILYDNFDSLVFTGGIKNLYSCVMIAVHGRLSGNFGILACTFAFRRK